VTMSLGVTPAQVATIARVDKGSAVPAPVAAGIAHTSVVFDLRDAGGRPLDQVSATRAVGDRTSLALRVDGGVPVQVRTIGHELFARVDIPALFGDYGQSQARARRLQAGIEAANRVIPGARALGEGDWVDLDLAATAEDLRRLAGRDLPTGDAAAAQGLRTLLPAVRRAFSHHATFTNSGDHGGRTEYTVKVASRAFLEELLGAARRALGVDPALRRLTQDLPTTVRIPASQRTVLEVWVQHNRVEEIDIDLNQFSHTLSFPVPLRIVIGASTPVGVPTGATTINPASILHGIVTPTGRGHASSSSVRVAPLVSSAG
jgi:hypothetical protein